MVARGGIKLRSITSRSFILAGIKLQSIQAITSSSSGFIPSSAEATSHNLVDYNAGLSLYGDKAKPKTFAARFATPDGSEVLSVVLRPSNQLKITFLEAKDVSDFGTLKEAKKIFVPGGTDLYSARVIKIKEDDGYRTYYFYEFGNDDQRAALVAAVNSGKELQGLLLPLSTTVASLFGQQSQFSAYNDRSISILGRTGCTFNWSDSGSCATGDCGSGQMECGGTTVPTPPVTVSYFNTYIEMENLIYSTYYNVSIINGYNLPMTIEPTGGIGFCLKTGCADDLNRRCPLELKLKDGKGCKSACQVNPSQ